MPLFLLQLDVTLLFLHVSHCFFGELGLLLMSIFLYDFHAFFFQHLLVGLDVLEELVLSGPSLVFFSEVFQLFQTLLFLHECCLFQVMLHQHLQMIFPSLPYNQLFRWVLRQRHLQPHFNLLVNNERVEVDIRLRATLQLC